MTEGPTKAFKQRVIARALATGCLEPGDYIALHADLASVAPMEHFADFGVWEGRRGVAPERLMGSLAKAVAGMVADPAGSTEWERGYRRSVALRPALVLPDLPDHRDLAMAKAVTTALAEVGVEARIVHSWPKDRNARPIVLRPDRAFFQSGRGESDFDRLAAAVIVTHAAPDEANFLTDLPYILGSAGVIATCAETAALLHQGGAPSTWVKTPVETQIEPPPIRHPLYAGLGRLIQASPPRAPWRDRPVDVLAIQPMTEGRRRAWKHLAEPLQDVRTIVYPPPLDATGATAETAMRRYLLDRSKIVLNLHAGDGGALPTMLAEEAALAGTLVVSEPCRPHLFMRQAAHYVEASARRMGVLLGEILGAGDEKAQKAIARSRHLWIEQADPEVIGLAIVNLLADVADFAR